MKTRIVISGKCLPTRLPIWSTTTLWLLFDRLDAPGWIYGAFGSIWGVFWILSIVLMLHERAELVNGFGGEV